MLYLDGETVYAPAIRYWEDPTPMRCRVVGNQHDDTLKYLYVHSQEYGHCVYMPLPVFYEETHARRYAALQTSIKCLQERDLIEALWQRMRQTFPAPQPAQAEAQHSTPSTRSRTGHDLVPSP